MILILMIIVFNNCYHFFIIILYQNNKRLVRMFYRNELNQSRANIFLYNFLALSDTVHDTLRNSIANFIFGHILILLWCCCIALRLYI